MARLLAFILFLAYQGESVAVELPLTERTVIEFADEQTAASELSKVDAFVESLSPFDRAARLRSERPVGQDEFLRFVGEEEARLLAETIGAIRDKLTPYAAHFPERILLVKTTGNEEGGAAYCRGDNVIVLPQKVLDNSPRPIGDLLLHELFHILSRNDAELRDALYAIVGFKPCPEIDLPESLKPRKITNPDAPRIEHYLEVTVDGEAVPVVPALLSSDDEYDPASGKSFFAYLTFKLLAVAPAGDRWQPRYLGSEPWLLDIADVDGFHEQIGSNTGYIIHPEEVLADNFVLLANGKRDVPSPEILERMHRVLTER